MASRNDDMGGTALVRQSSSSSCASQASSRSSLSNMGANLAAAATAVVNAPFVLQRTQLNFFMTRILFTQEGNADSLGARATKAQSRMNNSASNMQGSGSSLNFNNSASRFENSGTGNALLGHFDPDDDLDNDAICVFNDNARILPNSVAKSMPVIPFPPAAPESPRPVEGKDGIVMMEPTHRPASPKKHGENSAAEDDLTMPEALPLTDMSLHDSQPELDDIGDDDADVDPSEAMEEDEEAEAPEVTVAVAPPSPSPGADFKAKARRTVSENSKRNSVANVPAEQRVFPKNERRSVRQTSSKKDSIKRSQSDVRGQETGGTKEMSSSCH